MNSNKTTYQTPIIEMISLDNEISLTLNSFTPPNGPDEGDDEMMV